MARATSKTGQRVKLTLVYLTAPDRRIAEKIVRALLETRLIACGHITPPGKSLYVWQGKLENTREVIVWMKTTSGKFKAIEKVVKKLHPYDVPCLVEMSVTASHTPFQGWVENMVS